MKKHKMNIKFGVIYRNSPIEKTLAMYFIKAFAVNKKFFLRTPRKFNIIICNNETELKKQMGKYYQRWSTAGVTDRRDLVIRNPEFMVKKGIWKRKNFQEICTHEMCHVFWYSFYKTWTPSWLMEGLPCFVAEQFRMKRHEIRRLAHKYKINDGILDYAYLKENFKDGFVPRYPLWSNFVRFLVRKYHKRRFLHLMNTYLKKKTRANYNRAFKKIFGKSDRDLFREFLASLSK